MSVSNGMSRVPCRYGATARSTLPPQERWHSQGRSGGEDRVPSPSPTSALLTPTRSPMTPVSPGARLLNGPERTYFWISGFKVACFCQPHGVLAGRADYPPKGLEIL